MNEFELINSIENQQAKEHENEKEVLKDNCQHCGEKFSEHDIVNAIDEGLEGTLWVCPE